MNLTTSDLTREDCDMKAKYVWCLCFILTGMNINKKYFNHGHCYWYSVRVLIENKQ